MNRKTIKVLIIEDNIDNVFLIQELLKETDYIRFQLSHEELLNTAIKRLEKEKFDAIILDLNLPDSSGLETSKIISTKFPELPIVILTGIEDEDIAIKTLRYGVQEYLVKGKVSGDLIARSIRYAIERKKIENFLRESEKKCRSITDTIIEGLWIVDKEGKTTYVNQQLLDMLGYPIEEMSNRPFFDFVDINYKEEAKIKFEERKKGIKDRYDFGFLKKDGSVIWAIVSASPLLDEKGQFIGAMGLITDITERKKIERQLKKSEEIYRTIIEYSNDMIWTLDLEGRFVFFNKRSEKIGGYKLEELKGKTFNPLIVKEDVSKVIDIFQNVLHGQSREYEVTFINKYNKKITLWVNTAPMWEKGKIIGTVSFGRDITEIKKSQEDIKKTTEDLIRSNKELEQFAYIASHDLQEPLRSISSFTELLKINYEGRFDSDADEFIDYIIKGTKRMQQMINDLLSLSRISTRGKEFRTTNVTDILNKVLENLRSLIERNQALIAIDKMPIVKADESQLVQLFQNLIENAIKFRKKDITPQIYISYKQEDEQYIFSVKDNGIGIDPKNFPKLFIIFQRLHKRDEYPGTGIGLAICKKIVERHKGRIWLESQPGEGSTFYFSIPTIKNNGYFEY